MSKELKNKPANHSHCLNCNTPNGPYIYCKHLDGMPESFDVTGETQGCFYWTEEISDERA